MRNLFFAILIIGGLIGASANAQVCDDPLRQNEVCLKMQFMRAQVNALDAQRELMQVNYPYLKALGMSIRDTAKDIASKITMENPQHVEAIKNVANMTNAMSINAASMDPNALIIANTVRTQCLTCHANEAPSSGIKWGQVFKNDWESISKKCNAPGRNPYLCKSMNGMLSAYGYFLSASVAGVQNYEMSEKASGEILRILGEIKKNNILHMSEDFRANAEKIASEINTLAKNKDPEVFNRSMDLPNACMKCHESKGVTLQPSSHKGDISWLRTGMIR